MDLLRVTTYDHVSPVVGKLVREGLNDSALLAAIGLHLVKSTEERFATESAPSGEKWKDLAQSTIDHKGHDDILYDEGGLYESFDYEVQSPLSLLVGSTYEFARSPGVGPAIHQLGGWSGPNHRTRIPERPFLGVSTEDASAIELLLGAAVASSVRPY